MGVYIRLGRRHALWLEWRKEWAGQPPRIERYKRETLITAPLIQVIYTPL